MSGNGKTQNDDAPSRKSPVFKWLRRAAAGAVLGFALLGLILDWFRTCAIEVTPGGRIETCRAPEIADASVVAVAILFLVLVLPDFDEISAVGVSLKRRLDAVEQRTGELQSSFLALTTQLAQASASASVVNNIGYLGPDNSLDEIVARLAAKADRQASVSTGAPSAEAGELSHAHSGEHAGRLARDAGPEGTARALLAVRLIERWEELQEMLLLGPRYRTMRDANGPTSNFAKGYVEEINTVRQARNSAAHAQPISHRDLELAIDAADNLIEIARAEIAAQ